MYNGNHPMPTVTDASRGTQVIAGQNAVHSLGMFQTALEAETLLT